MVSILSDLYNKLLPFELLVFLQQISMVKFNLYSSSSHWLFRPLPYCLRLGLGLGINSNGPRVQRGLTIVEHGLGLGVGRTPYDGVSFPGFRCMKGWAFHYMKNRKGASALIAALGASLAVLQGPKGGGGGGGGGVVGRSPRAPIFFFRGDRSPIASLLGALILFNCRAWSPQNVCCGAHSPKIKIPIFLHTDSVMTCFVCCLLGIGTN